MIVIASWFLFAIGIALFGWACYLFGRHAGIKRAALVCQTFVVPAMLKAGWTMRARGESLESLKAEDWVRSN